jgi:hypothetical protein
MTDPLALARAAFDGSSTYFDANIRPGVEADLRQFQSVHPSGSKYLSDAYKTRSRIFRPKTRSVIRKNEAVAAEAFFSTLDVVSLTPGDETDDNQQASADIMRELLNYRLGKSVPWFLICMGAYQDAQALGIVISHQCWEFDPARGKDHPKIELIPVENLRFDAAADWTDPINSSPYVIQLLPMYAKDVKARMKPAVPGLPPRWMPLSDAELLTATRQYDSTRLQREDKRQDSTQQTTEITDFTIVWVHRNVIDMDGEDKIYYTLGTTHLLTLPAPLAAEYAHGQRPYVLGYSVIETHKNYPGGVSRLTRDIQGEANEIANQRIDNVKFAMNKRYFVRRNKQVDVRSLTRNIPGSVTLLTDPEADVKVVDTPDVTASSYQEQDRLNGDFDELAGNFSQSSVDSNRNLNETVGGMKLLAAPASQVTSYQLKTFVETWVEPVLRQIVLLEQEYETNETILALCAKKAGLLQRFGIDAVTDELLRHELTLTVNVGLGATSPSDKIQSLSLGMMTIHSMLADGVLERYGLDPSEIIKEVLGALGHKDGGRFFKSGGEQDRRLAQLQQQIDALQQALDAKMPPELLAATVAKLDAETRAVAANIVATGVKSAYSAMQAAETIATLPAVAPIADAVMASAGYQPPVPAGADPNYPQPALPMAAAAPAAPMNTSPMFPATGNPPGAVQGIETQAFDGV